MDAHAQLMQGARTLGIELSSHAARQMLDYLALLAQWNRAYNLTSVTDTSAAVIAHLLDSLSILGMLQGERVADIGTGAGLPGIPLAIAAPGRHFTLLDSRRKKTRFVRHASRELALENVEVIDSRVEHYRPDSGFDTVIARALAALPRLLELGGHLLAPHGVFLAMKGRDPRAEARGLPPPWRVQEIRQLQVPGLPAERHVVVIARETNND